MLLIGSHLDRLQGHEPCLSQDDYIKDGVSGRDSVLLQEVYQVDGLLNDLEKHHSHHFLQGFAVNLVKKDALDVLSGHFANLSLNHRVEYSSNDMASLVVELGNPPSADQHVSRGVLRDTFTRDVEVGSTAKAARPRLLELDSGCRCCRDKVFL